MLSVELFNMIDALCRTDQYDFGAAELILTILGTDVQRGFFGSPNIVYGIHQLIHVVQIPDVL